MRGRGIRGGEASSGRRGAVRAVEYRNGERRGTGLTGHRRNASVQVSVLVPQPDETVRPGVAGADDRIGHEGWYCCC